MSENELQANSRFALPEPNFIERDVNKITQEWIALYESRTGKTLQPAQIERILIDVGVYRENLLRIAIQEAAKQNLVNFASYPMLDYLGELVGVGRIPARAAETTVRFSLSEILTFNILIPKGTQVESKDGKIIFATLSDGFISAGELYVDIQVQAETVGIIGNGYLAGEIKNLITPIPYVENAENISESSGGADEEDDNSLRARIKQAPEKFSNAGSRGAYRYHAFSAHQDITDVAITSPSPGVVKIYPLTKSGNPSHEIINLVLETLNSDKIRPLTDQVIVESPERVDFSIQADLILYNFADVQSIQSLISQKIETYKQDLKSKLGRDIVPSQIIALLNSVYGVYKVDLISPAFQELDSHQWANCTGYRINISGYTNE